MAWIDRVRTAEDVEPQEISVILGAEKPVRGSESDMRRFLSRNAAGLASRERRSSPTRTRSILDMSPMNSRIGEGNLRTSVGKARICHPPPAEDFSSDRRPQYCRGRRDAYHRTPRSYEGRRPNWESARRRRAANPIQRGWPPLFLCGQRRPAFTIAFLLAGFRRARLPLARTMSRCRL